MRNSHFSRLILRVVLITAACIAAVPPTVTAQTTNWIGSVGDWGTSSNWSDGEPTLDVDAVLPSAGTPTVTLTGEACRSLRTGTIGAAGTLTVGTATGHGTRIDGAFTLNNKPTVSMEGLVMSPTATLSVGIGQFGVSTIIVDGTATLDGQLLVLDILAANGTSEVLRGAPLQGAFSMVSLPDDWSWRIEGNSLLLTKGPVPVEPTTWGRVKRQFLH